MKTFITFIIPVYNTPEEYLKKCLNSIFTQNIKNIEVICINDGSTTNILHFLNNYACQEKRLTVISQKNSGPAKAKQKGLSVAKGQYVWFVDSDDWIDEKALNFVKDNIENAKPEIIIFQSDMFNNEDKIFLRDDYHDLKKSGNERKWVNFSNSYEWLLATPTEMWSFIFERIFAQRNINLLNSELKIFEDAKFCTICKLCASNILILPKILYHYRIFSNNSLVSLSQKEDFKNYKDILTYANFVIKFVSSKNELRKYFVNVIEHLLFSIKYGYLYFSQKIIPQYHKEVIKHIGENRNFYPKYLQWMYGIGNYRKKKNFYCKIKPKKDMIKIKYLGGILEQIESTKKSKIYFCKIKIYSKKYF